LVIVGSNKIFNTNKIPASIMVVVGALCGWFGPYITDVGWNTIKEDSIVKKIKQIPYSTFMIIAQSVEKQLAGENIEFIKSAHLKNSITGNYETIPFLIKGKIGSQEIKIAYEIYESTFSAEDKVINDYIGKYQYLDVNKIVLISNAHFSSEVRKIAKLNKITIMQFNEAIDADWTKIIGKDFSVYFQPIHFDNIKDVFLIPVNKDDDTGREMESTNITLLDDKKNEIKSIPNWFLEKVKTNSQLNADIQNKIEADTSGDLYINLKTEGYLVKTNKKDIPIRAILSQLKHVLVLIIMTNGN